MLSRERMETVVELTRALIAQSSESGREDGAAGVLRRYMDGAGFTQVTADEYGNILGCLRGGRPGKRVLLDGHIDTVPVGDRSAWSHDPFGGEIDGGRLYGRGASDMKGAVAAFTAAAGFFAADRGGDFPGEIWVAGVVQEECFEGVAARAVSRAVRPDYVVIGEASQCDLKIGQRGRAEIVVETFGVPAHSANPDKGVNAVYAMGKVIEALRRLPPPEQPVLGRGILELTDIRSEPYPGASVVPAYCRATYDRRLLVGETPESVLAPIQVELDRLAAEDPSFRARASFARGEARCYTGNTIRAQRFFPGWLRDREEPFIRDILASLEAAGLTPAVTQYSFCTNGSHYAGEAGIPTVGLGPSREDLAHTVDEYVELSQLERACESYYALLGALLKP